MFKLLSGAPLFLLFIATQANAGFMFCEKKLAEIGVPEWHIEEACADKSIDPIKKMLETEEPEVVKNTVMVMRYSKYSDKKNTKGVSAQDALTVSKMVENEDEIQSLAFIIDKFPGEDIVNLAKKIPSEKRGLAYEISSTYPNDFKNFMSLVETQPIEKLSLYTIMEDSEEPKEKIAFLKKFSKEDVECGLSFAGVQKTVQSLTNTTNLCSQNSAGQLCGAKATIFEAISKNPQMSYANTFLRIINESEYFTKNQATLFAQIYTHRSSDYLSTELWEILGNDLVSDELVEKMGREVKKSTSTTDSIKKLLAQYPHKSRRVSAPPMARAGHKIPDYVRKSQEACYDPTIKKFLEDEQEIALKSCEDKYKKESVLECNFDVFFGESSSVCIYSITVNPSHIASNALTCQELDTVESIVAFEVLNNKNKKDTSLYMNDQYTKEKLVEAGVPEKVFAPRTMSK